jgi:tetratricopeptide (TPR) repeat protein
VRKSFSDAQALFNKGIALGELGRSEEEIAVYDDLLARFGNAIELPLREQVATALVNKGITLDALDRREEAIAVYDDVLTRFGNATEPALREQVATALVNKGITLDALDRREEAKSLARRRFRLSQANVRSTTHRRGSS